MRHGWRTRAGCIFAQLKDIRESCDRFVSLLKAMNRPLNLTIYGEWIKPRAAIFQAVPARFTPWEDILPQIWNSMQNIAGVPYDNAPGLYERLSLENYIRKDNPPCFFMEAENEHMFPTCLNRKILQQQNALGIPSCMKIYRNMEHGFFYSLDRKAQREALEDMISFAVSGKL